MRLATDAEILDLAYMAPDSMSHWYERAADSVTRFAKALQVDSDHVANITAILSPRVQVSRNARLAAQYFMSDSTDGMMKGRVRAIDHYVNTGQVSQSGQKIRNFSENLRGNFDACTIDVWACRSFGVDYEGPNSPAKSDHVYQLMAGRYRRLAKKYGVSPASFQASVWFGIRSQWGVREAVSDLDLCQHLPRWSAVS